MGLLEKAAGHLKDRAETYDKPEGGVIITRIKSGNKRYFLGV